jgi:hypothetical protein
MVLNTKPNGPDWCCPNVILTTSRNYQHQNAIRTNGSKWCCFDVLSATSLKCHAYATQLASVEWLLETGTDPLPIPPTSFIEGGNQKGLWKNSFNTEV